MRINCQIIFKEEYGKQSNPVWPWEVTLLPFSWAPSAPGQDQPLIQQLQLNFKRPVVNMALIPYTFCHMDLI